MFVDIPRAITSAFNIIEVVLKRFTTLPYLVTVIHIQTLIMKKEAY